jgi:hypothetical protein
MNFTTILIEHSCTVYMQASCKVRFSFTTVDSHYYAGGITDPGGILLDIEKKLPPHIKKLQHGKDKGSSKVYVEYAIGYDDSDLPKQKEDSFARFMTEDPYEELLGDDIELVGNIIKKTYGVSKDESDKIEYRILEGHNLIKALADPDYLKHYTDKNKIE